MVTTKDIIERRLFNQKLSASLFTKPNELIQWFGAVQSQDFSGAIWAISERLHFLGKEEIEKACNEGTLIRTHVLRPTWHFVTPKDISWMLDLTGARVKKSMSTYNSQLGLNENIFNESEKIISSELRNNNYLTRNELGILLKKNGITWNGNGLAHIVMNAELNASICSGPVKGKQQTYALFSDRVPQTSHLSKDEALAELAKRYFQSHGPAQLIDYVWWSGLLTTDAKKGISLNPELKNEMVDGKTYYFFDTPFQESKQIIYLLPNYDEYTVALRDREALTDHVDKTKLDFRQNSLFNNVILIEGKIEGVWRRTIQTKTVTIETRLFKTLNNTEHNVLTEVLREYANHLGLTLKTS